MEGSHPHCASLGVQAFNLSINQFTVSEEEIQSHDTIEEDEGRGDIESLMILDDRWSLVPPLLFNMKDIIS